MTSPRSVLAAYPFLREKYILMDCGASFGEGYGPIVVSQHPLKRGDLAKCRIGVPGLHTSAYMALKLYEPGIEAIPIAFDQILDAVKNSVVDAGLLIHEGQLFFSQMGMHKVVDNWGQWWLEQTGLPLPLGGNAVRRALGRTGGLQVGRAIHERKRGLCAQPSRIGGQLCDAIRRATWIRTSPTSLLGCM